MEVQLGRNQDVDAWMKLVEEISWNFPGLETKEGLNEYRETLLRFIEGELIEEFGYPNQEFILYPKQ